MAPHIPIANVVNQSVQFTFIAPTLIPYLTHTKSLDKPAMQLPNDWQIKGVTDKDSKTKTKTFNTGSADVIRVQLVEI
ncbi:hypothetical protein RHO12_00955 [Orbus sturtevantii]|uniref:hypothetical protein n=1 Tax=Orbus sturtevantii TaxID=3074109 RepID=UPI00370D4CF8